MVATPSRTRSRSLGGSLLLLALLVVLIGGGLLALDPYRVAGASMAPSLADGDHLVVNRLAYALGDPDAGDIVVFHTPGPVDATYVKRVVAVAGQNVTIHNGRVEVNGAPLTERHLPPGAQTTCGGPSCTLTVPEGAVYVLGDNREESIDSRFFGPIPISDIVGEAIKLS